MNSDVIPRTRGLVLLALLGVLTCIPTGYRLYYCHHQAPAQPAPLLMPEESEGKATPAARKEEPKAVTRRRSTFEKYLKTIGQHQLFLATAPPPAPVRANSITLESLLSKLTLMGVFDGKGGPEAIIGYSGKSYNCSGGEKVGPLVVKEVRKDGIVLQYGEETTEIRF